MDNKRDLILSLLNTTQAPAYTPAAFFLHFGEAYHRGQAAVDKHLQYFRETDMDFVKIQYELPFPRLPNIQRPADWADMPRYKEDFFEPQLAVIDGIVKAVKAEAMIVCTLYSPFMCAGHAVGAERMLQHIAEDPEAVRRGMEIVAESVLNFVKAGIRLGLDGFYTSTQGGERSRLADTVLFDRLVRPFDLMVMDEANAHCSFNILHICDYVDTYADISHFVNYPGQVVNTPLMVGGKPLDMAEAARLFERPVMGGLDRHGVLAQGTPDQVRAAARSVLDVAPPRFILAADCTAPADTSWDNLRAAIETAHQRQP
ncbi:MAG: uroporphyrinogen decarboxylase family protein [Chloroflexota bacterium]